MLCPIHRLTTPELGLWMLSDDENMKYLGRLGTDIERLSIELSLFKWGDIEEGDAES